MTYIERLQRDIAKCDEAIEFSAVKLEELVVQFDALGWSYGPSLGSLRIACSERQALWLTNAIQRAVTFCGMPANLKNV